MLKANVGLSRKISRDFNSTGYSVNLEGEIIAPLDDPEAITEKIRELFNLAQEALNVEIDRDQGEDAIGRRDEERPAPTNNGHNGHTNCNGQPPSNKPTPSTSASPKPEPKPSPPQNGHGTNGNPDAATNKQIQFLLTMGKRFKLTPPQLEGRIGEIIGRRCGVYDLTKKEAGLVLDHLTNSGNGNGRS
jgi:hypothetical protein